MFNVMTVCVGNVTRSPASEKLLRKLVEEKGLSDKIQISSCGISSHSIGKGVDRSTERLLKEDGIDPTHKATHISDRRISESALILVATQEIMDKVKAEYQIPDHIDIKLLGEFDPEGILDVHDPLGIEETVVCFAHIKRCLPGIITFIKDRSQENT